MKIPTKACQITNQNLSTFPKAKIYQNRKIDGKKVVILEDESDITPSKSGRLVKCFNCDELWRSIQSLQNVSVGHTDDNCSLNNEGKTYRAQQMNIEKYKMDCFFSV